MLIILIMLVCSLPLLLRDRFLFLEGLRLPVGSSAHSSLAHHSFSTFGCEQVSVRSSKRAEVHRPLQSLIHKNGAVNIEEQAFNLASLLKEEHASQSGNGYLSGEPLNIDRCPNSVLVSSSKPRLREVIQLMMMSATAVQSSHYFRSNTTQQFVSLETRDRIAFLTMELGSLAVSAHECEQLFESVVYGNTSQRQSQNQEALAIKREFFMNMRRCRSLVAASRGEFSMGLATLGGVRVRISLPLAG